MLRGFRWQLLVLLTAAVLFTISVILRVSQNPTPNPTPNISPTASTAATEAPAATSQALPIANVSQQPAGDGVAKYTASHVGTVHHLNPLLAPLNPVDQDITSLTFEDLTRTNQYDEAEPELAKSWVISSDGLEYIVQLHEDVLWQDGVPFE